ncbi:hypothetical protein KF840_09690 [bacterium]|nr:hypothetical protein [bacterium]
MPDDPRPRKERVIHTRVPESLDDEIKRRATDLGLSVSNLVRNILQNTFGLVEDIVHDSADIARSARGARTASGERGSSEPSAGEVVGWHLALLNVNAVCEACNAILPKGTRAGVGIVPGGRAIPIRCRTCLDEVPDGESGSPDE